MRHIQNPCCSWTSLWLTSVMIWAAVAHAQEIVLRDQVEVKESYVKLSDVAELRHWDAQMRSVWKDTPLLPAPVPGTTRYLHVRQLQELLMLHGFPVERVPIRGAARTEITANIAAVPEAARSDAQPNYTTRPGEDVLVAIRPIRAGERLRPDDVARKSLPTLPNEVQRPIRHLEDAVGRETARPLAAGQVLDASWLRPPLLVRRQREVTILARVGGVTVRLPGRALEDGAQDHVILVEWLDNKQKRLTARVVDFDTVEIIPQAAVSSAP